MHTILFSSLATNLSKGIPSKNISNFFAKFFRAWCKEREKTKKEQAEAKVVPAMKVEREELTGHDDDCFLSKVIGVDTSNVPLSKEKFEKCSWNVSLRLCISQVHEHCHIESKKPDVMPVAKECKIGFCVEQQMTLETTAC